MATACVAGRPACKATENRERVLLAQRIAAEVQRRGWQPHILLLPGGYFFLDGHIGPLSHVDRIERLSTEQFSSPCLQIAQKLGAIVVVGVDSQDWIRPGGVDREGGDQFCVAWNDDGIAGIGRKVFPATNEAESLLVYQDDFGTPARIADLGDRGQALLCACYDLYGCTESANAPANKRRNIRRLEASGVLLERKDAGKRLRALLRRGVGEWCKLVRKAQVGLAAIHWFARRGPGSGKAYWQRHGIQRASEVLGGRAAFGATHLEPPLPPPEVAVFAAQAGKTLGAMRHFYFQGTEEPQALVRLFEVSE